jgi:hypothetical protein
MAAIHVLLPDRSQTVYDEMEIPDLIRDGRLRTDQFFWKEGMPEWRPLAELSFSTKPFIPARRKTTSLPRWPGAAPIITRPSHAKNGADSEGDHDDPPIYRQIHHLHYQCEPCGAIVLSILVTTAGIAGMLLWLDISFAQAADFLNDANYLAARNFLTLAQLSAIITAQVAFFIWLYRACANCRRCAPELQFTPGWAVGCFFVPVLNLYLPYQAMQEVWKVSWNPRNWFNLRESFLVIAWWILFWLNWVLLWGSAILLFKAVAHQSFDESMLFLELIDVTAMLGPAVTIAIVAVVNWNQKKLSHQPK